MVTPERSISSREITVTGKAVSPSMRLMFEPVTSIFSIFCACWANAPPEATDSTTPAPMTCASAMESALILCFIYCPPGMIKNAEESVAYRRNHRPVSVHD